MSLVDVGAGGGEGGVCPEKEKSRGLKLPEEDQDGGVPAHSPRVQNPVFPLPNQVSRHLSKLFDSLCKLKFRLDADGKPLKVSLGMYSKEDEYVDFDRDCDLSGQVSTRAHRRAKHHPRLTAPQGLRHRRAPLDFSWGPPPSSV